MKANISKLRKRNFIIQNLLPVDHNLFFAAKHNCVKTIPFPMQCDHLHLKVAKEDQIYLFNKIAIQGFVVN